MIQKNAIFSSNGRDNFGTDLSDRSCISIGIGIPFSRAYMKYIEEDFKACG
jgi:hypothetical protein